MTPADLKELTRLAAVAMGLRLEWDGPPDQWQPMYYEGKSYHRFDPLNNAEQQLEMRRALRISVECHLTQETWLACHYAGPNTWVSKLDPNDNLAALMVAAELGRRKEQANEAR